MRGVYIAFFGSCSCGGVHRVLLIMDGVWRTALGRVPRRLAKCNRISRPPFLRPPALLYPFFLPSYMEESILFRQIWWSNLFIRLDVYILPLFFRPWRDVSTDVYIFYAALCRGERAYAGNVIHRTSPLLSGDAFYRARLAVCCMYTYI